jgi:undecaprenyl-diphosphatase
VGDLNRHVFDAINGWPDSFTPFLPFFSIAMSYVWVKIVLGALLIGLAWRAGPTRRTAVQALIAFPIANGMTDLFKHYAGTPRPCSELAHVALHGIGCSGTMGTASAHSANMAAVAFVFVYHLRWWGSPWVLIAILTGLSRIYIGAHYPAQVLLGYTCGVAAAAAVTLGWSRFQAQRNPASERDTVG